MGLYIRKSISVGPFRFNLSKSGIGVSAGVKGLRFGVGPRGNYVQMGRGGLYYRATIPRPSSRSSTASRHEPPSLSPRAENGPQPPLEEIESADAAEIVDSSSRELLDEIKEKTNKAKAWPVVAVASTLVVGVGLLLLWPKWLLIALSIVGLVCVVIAQRRDALAKTVVIFYDLDSEMERAYGQLHQSADSLAASSGLWHIEARGRTQNEKYHAGAGELLRRQRTFVRKQEPPYVKTNIETFAIGCGKQTLHFFPDRVLVYDQAGVGAVSYQALRVGSVSTRFIESEAVPSDAKVVGITWKYVNKSGGPDRRFRDNKELPLCQYEEISLSSQTGLNEVLQVSKFGTGKAFADAIATLGRIHLVEKPFPRTGEESASTHQGTRDQGTRGRGDQRQSEQEAPPAHPATGKQWFTVLMVNPSASAEEIKEAYRRRMAEYHPDKVATLGVELRALAEQKSKEINAAFIEAARALKQR